MDFGDIGLGGIVDDAPVEMAPSRVKIDWHAIREAVDNALDSMAGKVQTAKRRHDARSRVAYTQYTTFGKGLLRVRNNLDALLSGFAGDVTRITADRDPQLPFSKDEGPHLFLQTPDVIMEHANRHNGLTEIYNLGPYIILIPLVMHPTQPRVHWLPVRAPKTPTRHIHHHVRYGEPATCLGTFRMPMAVSWRNGRLIEYATLCTAFVHIYNQSSPLVHMPSIEHRELIDTVRRPRRSLHQR